MMMSDDNDATVFVPVPLRSSHFMFFWAVGMQFSNFRKKMRGVDLLSSLSTQFLFHSTMLQNRTKDAVMKELLNTVSENKGFF